MTGREFPKRDRNSVLVYVAGVGKGPDGTPGGFAYCIVSLRQGCVSGLGDAAWVTSRENERQGVAEPMSAAD